MLQIGIAIGRVRGVERQPLRIGAAKCILEFVARRLAAAAHAADQIEPAVQIDHLPVAGGLMQPVDVLGQQHLAPPVRLEPGQRMMRIVRTRLAEAPPADQAARPVALARRLFRHEGLEVDRLGPLPVAMAVAIVGNARIGAAAGAGQHEQIFVPVDEILERMVCQRSICHGADVVCAGEFCQITPLARPVLAEFRKEREAAAGIDDLPGDVARVIRGEKGEHGGDLFRGPDAAQRNVAGDDAALCRDRRSRPR